MARVAPEDQEADLLDALRALYARADARYAGWSCPSRPSAVASGVSGREPYVTSLEQRALARAVARRGGPLAGRRRALPLALNAAAERACPLLHRAGRCAAVAHRPLGCRMFDREASVR